MVHDVLKTALDLVDFTAPRPEPQASPWHAHAVARGNKKYDAHPGYRSRRGGSLHRALNATASPAASTCRCVHSSHTGVCQHRVGSRPEHPRNVRGHASYTFSSNHHARRCAASSPRPAVRFSGPGEGVVATAQDGVVLRWCGERGWKLRGLTGLASSILVAVVDFLGRASNLRTEYTHTSDGLTNAPTPTSTCATNAWEPLLLGGA